MKKHKAWRTEKRKAPIEGPIVGRIAGCYMPNLPIEDLKKLEKEFEKAEAENPGVIVLWKNRRRNETQDDPTAARQSQKSPEKG